MGGLNEFTGGLQSIISGLQNSQGTTGDLFNKIEKTLQISIAKITYRNNDFTKFKVGIGEIQYNAVLFFGPKFYVLNGYPKLGEYVIVVHNNGNDAHIMFTANPKDVTNPPLGGKNSSKVGIFSAAKCSL